MENNNRGNCMSKAHKQHPKAIHNNVCWIIEKVVRDQLSGNSRIQPLFRRFAEEATDDELYFAVLVLSFGKWTDQWKITADKGSFGLFQALAEPIRGKIEKFIVELRVAMLHASTETSPVNGAKSRAIAA